ncbi:hypothetical protein UFOVP1299_34 [uncultured Caudovirales phage]|uniref:Uncharacterized protein n=1 Tax=uncultured Caudovirales phage TaxID=2100421 RepID=A0A6J5RNP3_9CAUD|nr:hypothetical protein UFOVP1299_34 [uncultured Caudovirales phage]
MQVAGIWIVAVTLYLGLMKRTLSLIYACLVDQEVDNAAIEKGVEIALITGATVFVHGWLLQLMEWAL